MAHVGPARADHPPLEHGDDNFMNVVGQTVSVFSAHCEVAARIGQRLGLSENIQRNLRQLYERWDGHGFPNHLAGEAIAVPVRLVLVVQDALALLDIMPMEPVGSVIAARSGGPYDPAVVDAFLPLMPRLLTPVSDEEAWAAAMDFDAAEDAILSETEIDGVSEVIADFIDRQITAHCVAENNQFSLFEPRDFFANGDKVVVTGHYTMTQKKTGKPVDSDWAHIFTFKGGKIAGWRELNDSTAFYKAYR